MLTVYLILKKKKRFFIFKQLSPKALNRSIITLGASFIKLAQVLATRADFFSAEYLDELKSLHDKLPPMSHEAFERVYHEAFHAIRFENFEQEPIDSASIGQVHVA